MSDQASTPDAGDPQPSAALEQTLSSDNSPAATVPLAPAHGGALLRQARLATGMHIAALAVALKVPVRQLEALEEGQFDRLPDPIFTRALASSICRQLRIDPKPVLAALPMAPSLAPRVGGGINAPFQRPGMPGAPGLVRFALRPSMLIAAALTMAALGLLFMPSLFQIGDGSKAADTASGSDLPPAAEAPEVVPPAIAASAGPSGQGGMSGMVVEPVQPPMALQGPSTGTGAPAPIIAPANGRMP